MRILITIICLLYIGSAFAYDIEGKIINVIDGDTCTILTTNNKKIKIRLYGIDAPELSQEYGVKAAKILQALILQQNIRASILKRDKYRRSIAKIYLADLYINQLLLKIGVAWHYKKYSRDSDLAKAEQTAILNHIGLWQNKSPIPPWIFRKK